MPGSVAERPSCSALAAANVNARTGFATDYLNVFHEPLLLIGLAGAHPDMLEDLAAWSAPDYREHFQASGLAARDVILAAYEAAEPHARRDFTHACRALEEAIQLGVRQLQAAAAAGGDVAALAAVVSERLQGDLAKLDARIHGQWPGRPPLDDPAALATDT